GRAGDVARLYLLRAREGVPIASSLAASLLERVMEALALIALAAPVVLTAPSLPGWARTTSWILAAIGVAGAFVAWLVARRAGTTSHLARFAQGLQSARRGLAFAEVMALSVGIWLIDAADILLCADAVGLSIPWTVGPVLVMLALAFALAVPS